MEPFTSISFQLCSVAVFIMKPGVFSLNQDFKESWARLGLMLCGMHTVRAGEPGGSTPCSDIVGKQALND